MNKVIFGKTMENVCNHVRLVTRWDEKYGIEVMIAKLNFHSRSVFSENLIAIEKRKLKMKFDKPIYIGMYLGHRSKMYSYKFHYEYMTQLFRENCEVMYTRGQSNLSYQMRRCLLIKQYQSYY